MSDLTRRNFLVYGGAVTAGVLLGQLVRRQLALADAIAASRGATEERWAVSVCRECPAACGIRVRLIDGLPVKLEGNPLCPISRGRLCAKGQAAIEACYDPDRLTGPARRVGPHGSGRWERIGWDEALAMLVARLRDPANRGHVWAMSAEEASPIASAWAQVWRAAGGRVSTTEMATAARLHERFRSMTGVAADPLFDYERATHVLSFGAPLVEDWLSPIWSQRAFGRFRRHTDGRPRGRLVQVEGRRSMTARKADEWIAVSADRQAFLAYGMAAVLLRENRVDRQALDPYLRKLDQFEQTVTARFTPDEVAAATGVPVVTVLRLARELVSNERPLVVVHADAPRELIDAVFALDLLLGAFDREGGVFAAQPALHASPVSDPPAAAGATPRIVLLRDSAPFRSLGAPPAFASALNTAEFVVSFSPFLDEAASVADLVLPTHTALEAWHAVAPATCLPGQAMAVARPAVAPLFETRDLVQVLKAIASGLGGPAAEACPWASSEALVGEHVAQLAGLRRGGPYVSAYETDWLRQLERGGWWMAAAETPDGIAQAISDAGGWADPFFETGQVRRRAAEHGGCTFPLPPVLNAPPLAPTRLDAVRPLQMHAFVPAAVNRLGSMNQPVLFELLGQPEARPWGPWVEVSPGTAEMVGVATGGRAVVESDSGSVEASVVVVEGMPAGVVALALVPAVPTGGRWAREITRDVRSLAGEDALRAGPVPVRLRKA